MGFEDDKKISTLSRLSAICSAGGIFMPKNRMEGKSMVETRESVTAKLCSFARAFHSNIESNKIFDNYLAYDLMGKDEYEEIGQLIQNDFDAEKSDKNFTFASKKIVNRLNRYITPIPLSRIAFAERELHLFAQHHGKCQYVICGAGIRNLTVDYTEKKKQHFHRQFGSS